MDSINNDSNSLIIKVKQLLQQQKYEDDTTSQAASLLYHQTINERYLTSCCCILLAFKQQHTSSSDSTSANTSRSILQTLMKDNSNLKLFLHELIKVKQSREGEKEQGQEQEQKELVMLYQRMGVQLLKYYYDPLIGGNFNVGSSSNDISDIIEEWKQHFLLVHGLLSHRSALMNEIKMDIDISMDVIDVELVQLLSLLLQTYVHYSSYLHTKESEREILQELNKWMNENRKKFNQIPSLILGMYYNDSNNHQQRDSLDNLTTTDENKKDRFEENEKQNLNRTMAKIISSILDQERQHCYNEVSIASSASCVDNNNNNMKKQLELIMVTCFNHYVKFMQKNMITHSHYDKGNDSVNILSQSLLLKMIQSITTNTQQQENITVTETLEPDTSLLLHISLLSIIHLDITYRAIDGDNDADSSCMTHNILESISTDNQYHQKQEEQQNNHPSTTDSENQLINAILKLILFNLSSALDYFTVYDNKSGKKGNGDINNNTNNHMMIARIRTMTLDILWKLMDDCGIDWICNSSVTRNSNGNDEEYDSSKSLSTSSLGEANIFCTVVRLVVGELRLVMGHLIDAMYSKNEDENDDHSADESIVYSNDLERAYYCFQIGLNALHVMVNLAKDTIDDDDDDDNNEKSIAATSLAAKFNPDAILHIKHSLDDMLDSTVQFLLRDNIPLNSTCERNVFWERGAFECCRYLGAYLSETDIFEYDNGAESIEEENEHNFGKDGDKTTIGPMSSLRLFMALRNGLLLFHHFGDTQIQTNRLHNSGRNSGSVITLFPCLLALLSSCFDDSNCSNSAKNERHIVKRRIKMVREFLMNDNGNDDLIIDILCSEMDKKRESFEENAGVSDNEMSSFLWCNVVSGKLFRFMVNCSNINEAGNNDTSSKLSTKDGRRVERIYKCMSHWLNFMVSIESDEDSGGLSEKHTGTIFLMLQNLAYVKSYVSSDTLSRISEDVDDLLEQF